MNPDDFNKILELQAIIDEWEEDFDRNSQIEQIDNKYLQQIYNLIDTWREKDRETGISRKGLLPTPIGRPISKPYYKEQASGGETQMNNKREAKPKEPLWLKPKWAIKEEIEKKIVEFIKTYKVNLTDTIYNSLSNSLPDYDFTKEDAIINLARWANDAIEKFLRKDLRKKWEAKL